MRLAHSSRSCLAHLAHTIWRNYSTNLVNVNCPVLLVKERHLLGRYKSDHYKQYSFLTLRKKSSEHGLGLANSAWPMSDEKKRSFVSCVSNMWVVRGIGGKN